MVSDRFPTTEGQIYDEVKRGFPDATYSKPILFVPTVDMQFTPGRHDASNKGIVEGLGIKLLHFRYLGYEYCQDRNATTGARLTQENKSRGYGTHILETGCYPHTLKWYAEREKEAKDVTAQVGL